MLGVLPWKARFSRRFAGQSSSDFLLRVLAYDRNLKTRAKDAVPILLVYQEGNKPSETAKNDLLGALEKVASQAQLSGLPIRVSAQAYSNVPTLNTLLDRAPPAAECRLPGLDQSVAAISELTRKRSILSFTGTEPFVRTGVSNSMVARGSRASDHRQPPSVEGRRRGPRTFSSPAGRSDSMSMFHQSAKSKIGGEQFES